MESEANKVNRIGTFDGCRWSMMRGEDNSGTTLNQRVVGSSPTAPTIAGLQRAPIFRGFLLSGPNRRSGPGSGWARVYTLGQKQVYIWPSFSPPRALPVCLFIRLHRCCRHFGIARNVGLKNSDCSLNGMAGDRADLHGVCFRFPPSEP